MHAINIAKLRWQCRRGMLELDVILNRILECTFPTLSEVQQIQFEQMLNTDDPTLYAWLIGAELPVDRQMAEIVKCCAQYNEK